MTLLIREHVFQAIIWPSVQKYSTLVLPFVLHMAAGTYFLCQKLEYLVWNERLYLKFIKESLGIHWNFDILMFWN